MVREIEQPTLAFYLRVSALVKAEGNVLEEERQSQTRNFKVDIRDKDLGWECKET